MLSSLSNLDTPTSVSSHLQHLESMLSSSSSFRRISFDEAAAYLDRKLGKSLNATLEEGLSKADEQNICMWVGNQPVFITDFPTSQKPFYCALSSIDSRVSAVDLLVPGIGELVGGSVRESDAVSLRDRMRRQKLDEASVDWYAGLRGHGGAPTGGFGLGFDRLLLWILGIYNIRDTVPFPRELNKFCL